jgi:hypothetical protein
VKAGKDKLQLVNTDFDTGKLTHTGEYSLTDQTYAHLLDQLAQKNFSQIAPDLRENILAFYRDPAAPNTTKRNAAVWQKTQDEVQRLREPSPPVPSIQISERP